MQSLLLHALKLIATLVSGLGKEKKLFILIYHRVLDDQDYMRPVEVDKKVFTWQMELLSNYFNVLPLAEALEKNKTATLPSRAVAITFDDGYSDNYLNALPILKKYGLNATFFIASGYLNGGIMWNDQVVESIRRMTLDKIDLTEVGLDTYQIDNEIEKSTASQQIINKIKHLDVIERQKIADFISLKVEQMPTDLMMTNEQVIKLHQSGMEIGGHTVSHPIMAKLDEQTVEKELKNNNKHTDFLFETNNQYDKLNFSFDKKRLFWKSYGEYVERNGENDYSTINNSILISDIKSLRLDRNTHPFKDDSWSLVINNNESKTIYLDYFTNERKY